MRRPALALAFSLSLSASLIAHDSSWANVADLQPGNKVTVFKTNSERVEGRFVTSSNSEITLQDGAERHVIPREQVSRVTRTSRGRNALVGLAIGAGVGVALGVAMLEREDGYAGAVAGTAIGFGGIGAAIGATRTHTVTIYRKDATALPK